MGLIIVIIVAVFSISISFIVVTMKIPVIHKGASIKDVP